MTIKDAELTLEKRFLNPNFVSPTVVEVWNDKVTYQVPLETFPLLNSAILNMGPTDTR